MIAKNIIESIEKVQQGLRQFFDYLQSPSTEEAKQLYIPLINKDEFGDMARRINKK